MNLENYNKKIQRTIIKEAQKYVQYINNYLNINKYEIQIIIFTA